MEFDLLVYHDLTDTVHSQPPSVGQNAEEWFGEGFKDLFVTAVGPGIHDGRITVVLANESRPEMQQDLKQFFGPR